jgi:hypothetical protein
MKKIIPLLLASTLLTGCIDLMPVTKMKFPEVPQELKDACPDLKDVNPNTKKISEVLPIVVENYGTYYQCKIRVDAWIEWYNTQKEINDSVK